MQQGSAACATAHTSFMQGRGTDNISSVVVFGVASVYHQASELTRTLQAQSCVAVKQVTGIGELDIHDNATLYILLTPQLVPLYPKLFIAYQVEQWGTTWLSRTWGSLDGSEQGSPYAEVFQAAVEVWDYNLWNIDQFDYPSGMQREHVRYMPFAWFPSVPEPSTDAREIDVLFFGAMNDKRETKLSYIRERGVNITIVTAQEAELDAFVLRAKIVLNLHYYDGLLETSRIMHAISLKALVISEPAKDPKSNADFAKAVIFEDDVGAITDSVVYYLKNDRQRQQVIETAYAYTREKFSLQPWLLRTCVGAMLKPECCPAPPHLHGAEVLTGA